MTAVLSKAQAESLFQGGELSPHDDALTAQIKTERRQRAAIKRYVPTQRSETCCMGSGRRAHWPWRDSNAAPGPVRHTIKDGFVTPDTDNGTIFSTILDIQHRYNRRD